MFGIDTSILIMGGLIGLWELIKWKRPSWAKRVREIENLARPIADGLWIASHLFKFDKGKAMLVYVEKATQELKRKKIPVTTKEIEVLKSVWWDKMRDVSANQLIDSLVEKDKQQ